MIGIIGLGYVGLPLAVEFGKKYSTIGFDLDVKRIEELKEGVDRTFELTAQDIKNSVQLQFSSDVGDLRQVNIFIVTVPTPIDATNCPDLTAIKKATQMIGYMLKEGDIVVYESTVYPGVTEEVCAPMLEQYSGLVFNKDFFCGYSPERINPGDKHHTITKIKKVTAGSTPETATKVDELYASVITAGTYPVSSIKVAEAAKVIENAQRDINIAFVNELAMIFNLMKIDTQEVLNAASTKWNFLSFQPGLVGGHCISVDPYYLTYKAQELGYNPEVILSGRRVNDNMGKYIASQAMKMLIKKGGVIGGAKALVLGITFKENCHDTRNSKAFDIVQELLEFGMQTDVYDPWADEEVCREQYGIDLIEDPDISQYQVIILAVAHKDFLCLDLSNISSTTVIYDVKSLFDRTMVDARL